MLDKLTLSSVINTPWVLAWFKKFCDSKQLSQAQFYKRAGLGIAQLLHLLVVLPMTHLKVYTFSGDTLPVAGRDAFYRMLSNTSYNWRMLLLSIALKMTLHFDTLTDDDQPRCLIFDDTGYKRDRSKCVEYLGRQHDHSHGRYFRGFRMLTVVWSDGHSCLPLGFELLTNEDADKRIGPDPKVDKRTNGGKRVIAATQKATDLTIAMAQSAYNHNFKMDYVLFDSWFAFPQVIKEVAKHTPVICRGKNTAALKFKHQQKIYSVESLPLIFKQGGQTFKNPDIIGSAVVELLNTNLKVRVVVVTNRHDPDKKIVFISTDTQLSADEICCIYARRWDIEVCFKAIKQHLGFYCMQMRDYSGLVGCCSVVIIRYLMLAYYHRGCIDDRTLPGMFHACVQQLQAATIEACIEILRVRFNELAESKLNQPVSNVLDEFLQMFENFKSEIMAQFEPIFKLNLKCES